jgi:hypothetical protein
MPLNKNATKRAACITDSEKKERGAGYEILHKGNTSPSEHLQLSPDC